MSREVSFGQNRPSEGSRLAGKPHAANTLRRALRNLMTRAIDIGIRGDDPTRDVKAIRIKSHSWTDLEIAQFERCHAIGSRARLALALLLYTGQRRGDVIRMGTAGPRWYPTSSRRRPAELAIPMHPDLAAVIAATPSGHLTRLTTTIGGPFAATTFTHWLRRE